MAKLSHRQSEKLERVPTHEGGVAVRAPAHMELLLTAASTFLGESTFYESGAERERRLRELVHTVTDRDPALVERIARELRTDYKIRTAAILVACEYVAAKGPRGRAVIDSVIQRPDECAEVVAYWHSRHGRHLPWALRRGVADAAVRVYTERNVLKYDGRNASVAPADVIELTHPRPRADWQRALFGYLLDQRHHGDGIERSDELTLPMLHAHHNLGQLPADARRGFLREHPDVLLGAGYTWEALSGWLPGGMDAEAWETVIPGMGVMALLRNLRNFDKAGISRAARAQVATKLTDADEVTRSRIFPYRVFTAYEAAPSDEWRHVLATTLDLAAPNLPRFDRSLFLVDVSYSMNHPMSDRSRVPMWRVAALTSLLVASVSTGVDIVAFDSNSQLIRPRQGASVLRQVHEWSYPGGGGTHAMAAMGRWFDPAKHDRVVIFTDEQWHDSTGQSHPPWVVFNLAGYAPHPDWGRKVFHFGGLSDATLRLAAEISQPSS